MSIFSDLLSFVGAAGNSKNAQDQTNALAKVQQNQQNYEKGVIESGQIDPYGNVINRRDPSTGAFKTTLAPGTQSLADTTLQNNVNAEKNRSLFGELSGQLTNKFDPSMIRDPLSRQEAQGIVDKDNQRTFNSVIDPITNKLAMTAQRTFGNTSNIDDFLATATKEILPGIQIGGERDALALADADVDRFIKNTLQLGEGLNNASTGQQISIPGVASANEVTNMLNSVSVPSTVPVNDSSHIFNTIASAGSLLDARGREAQNSQERQQLLQLLQRQLGNQGT